MEVLEQRPGDDVDDGGAHRFGKRLGDCTNRWTVDDGFVAVLDHGRGDGRSARTASTPRGGEGCFGFDELADRIVVAAQVRGLLRNCRDRQG
jgi:hypothetical protein